MKTTISTIIVILFTTASVRAGILANPIFNPATGHSYYLLGPSGWTVAEAEAVSLGGHLVTVNNSEENSWLLSTFSNYGGQPRALWTGLSDKTQEGTFLWSSGESASYRNWEPGQPDDGSRFYPSEDYVHIWPSTSTRSPGLWNDKNDSPDFAEYSFKAYGVVEVPEPAGISLFVLGFTAWLLGRGSKK